MTWKLAAALGVPAAVLAALVAGGWGSLQDVDASAVRTLTLDSGLARDLVLGVTQLGAPLLLEVVTLVGAVALLRRGSSRVAVHALLAVFGAEVLSSGLKALIGRSRPCEALLHCPVTTSFPSGHATGAAAFWVTLAVLLLPRVGRRSWWLLAVPAAVALSRVLLGVHYPSDVVGGLLVGGCWAVTCAAAIGRVRARAG